MRKMSHRKKATYKFNKKIAIAMLSMALVAVLLVATFAWYQSQVVLKGSTFTTGTIDFIAMGYDEDGQLVTTILQEDKDETKYEKVNNPLFNKTGWSANHTDTAYIVVENTGSLDMEYRITFSASGEVEYLGGFWYALTNITKDVTTFESDDKLTEYISTVPAKQDESKGYSMATMDRYATTGTIKKDGTNKHYYRLDYGMKESAISEEYTGKTVSITPQIFVTQVGALGSGEGYGYTYNCSTVAELEKARDSSLPGDTIKLVNNITFEGDLVFNKAVNIITNNFTLEVKGNLIYDFVSSKSVTIDVTGNGSVKVTSPGEGIGGNFTVTAPGSDVSFNGSNKVFGDIVVAANFTVNATNAYGAAGATLNQVKIFDSTTNQPATVYVSSNTRVTVTDNTTVTRMEAVAKSNNIEIQNAGTITTAVLSGMNVLPQTVSPQIYIVNMGYMVEPIELPAWSSKFEVISSEPLTCEGNTRIVQTITGNNMSVVGSSTFTAADIERESTDVLVAPIGNSDGELVIYYQDYEENGSQVIATIKGVLEKYFRDNGKTPSTSIAAITRLDIVSIGDKAITSADIEFFKSEEIQSLRHLDMQRASVIDTATDTPNKLCDGAFHNFTRFTTLILPQNLEEIGALSLSGMNYDDIITIPGSVTTFGQEWFKNNNYVAFAAATPVLEAYSATSGMSGISAIFVEEYYVDTYKSAYEDYSDIIFPMAQKDDSRVNFVRRVAGSNEWEIVFYTGSDATTISVGEGLRVDDNFINVTRVGDGAYKKALKDVQATVSFADSVKSIGESAFAGTKIVSVTSWGSSLETIHSSAFNGCKQLSGDIYLPETMQTIHSSAFYGCGKITGFNAGGTVLVEDSALAYCTALVWVEMPNVETLVQMTGGNKGGMFYYDSSLVSVKLPSLKNSTGIIFNYTNLLAEVVFGDSNYNDVAVSSYRSFYSNFGSPNIFFNTSDVSGITMSNTSLNTKIYPIGEKMGVKYVGNNTTYNIGEYIVSDTLSDDGTVTLITTNIDSLSGEVSIPSEWNGNPITRIYTNAFRNSSFSNVTLVFPDGLKEIGDYAFYGRKGIIAVSGWGDSIETIGKYAFSKSGLTGELKLPNEAPITIEDYAFSECTGLTSVDTGSVTTVGNQAFSYCSSIVTAKLPNVVECGNSSSTRSFYYCTSLVSVEIPKLNKVYGSGVFERCYSLREIYMENSGSPSLGSSPFKDVTSSKLIKIYVPEALVSDYKGLSNFVSVKNQIYPVGTKVGTNEINGYNIGEYIIQENEDGETATLIASMKSYTGDVILDDTLNGLKITSIGEYAFVNQTFTDASVTFGQYTTEIQQFAFNGVVGIIELNLNNVEEIGGYAFQKCSDIVQISAPNLLKITGSYCFEYCTSLKTLSLPKLGKDLSDYSLPTHSFGYCSSLTSVSLPELITVNNYAFEYNTVLENIYFEKITSFTSSNVFRYSPAIKKFIINREVSDKTELPTGPLTLTSATNCVILVPYFSVSYYQGTTGLWNGRPVESYDKTFTDADSNVYLVELDGSDCTIEHFIGNGPLTTVVIPNTMLVDEAEHTVIGISADAFKSVASSLTSITLPSGMYDFGSNSLTELPLLSQILVDSANIFYMADADGVLYSKDGRMLVKYPIGKTNTAYTVNDAVVAIGEYAFSGCVNLTEVTFGSAVTVIDSTAFADCELQKVVFTGNTPPLLMGTEIFDCDVDGFAMTVPEGTAETYVSSMNFAKYASFINNGTEIPATGKLNIVHIGIGYGTVEYAALPPEPTDVEPVDEDESEPPPDPGE